MDATTGLNHSRTILKYQTPFYPDSILFSSLLINLIHKETENWHSISWRFTIKEGKRGLMMKENPVKFTVSININSIFPWLINIAKFAKFSSKHIFLRKWKNIWLMSSNKFIPHFQDKHAKSSKGFTLFSDKTAQRMPSKSPTDSWSQW